MKKLLICILCFSATQSFAQLRLGIHGSFASLNFWQGDRNTGAQSGANTWEINGFQGGVYGEYDLGYSGLVLAPSVNYAVNGSHLLQSRGFGEPSSTETIGYTNTTVRVYSIRVPVNLLYRVTVNNKVKIFGGLGPYVAYNTNGTEKGFTMLDSAVGSTHYAVKHPINDKLKFESGLSSPSQNISRVAPFDFGLDILLGCQYKKWQFSMSYNRGITQLYRTNEFNAGNAFWMWTIGYQLFGKERAARL